MKQGNEALGLMYSLIAIASILAIAFFILPLAFFARRVSMQANSAPTLLFLFYFACLGYGFMMIELPLLQRLILFLGYPVYALAVVLSGLLVFSGIGSFISSKTTVPPGKALSWVLIVIVGIGLIYVFGMRPLLSLFRASPIAVRIVLSTVLLAPIGLVLGMAFPLGISALDRLSSGMIPWAWGLNGAFSVVASVLAPFLGSRIGFSAALLTGILAYATAWVAVMLARRMTAG